MLGIWTESKRWKRISRKSSLEASNFDLSFCANISKPVTGSVEQVIKKTDTTTANDDDDDMDLDDDAFAGNSLEESLKESNVTELYVETLLS